MTQDNSMIKDVSIEKRINDGISTATVTFHTPLAPDEFQVGMPFELIIDADDIVQDFVVFRGLIESVQRDEADNNRVYSITARDEGRLLSRQPFNLPCEELAKKKYTYVEILTKIVENTNLKLGTGVPLPGKV